MLSVDDIFSEENIKLALANVTQKNNSCGTDGVWTSEIGDFWDRNNEKIVDTILSKLTKKQICLISEQIYNIMRDAVIIRK